MDSTASARPTPKADSAGGPSDRVRCPPSSGTSYSSQPCRTPRRESRPAVPSATIVSTMPIGRAPIAARSLTLVSTAAMPAPNGSCCTKLGSNASPHATTNESSNPTAAPSSPGPLTQSVVPKSSDTKRIGFFACSAAQARTRSASCGSGAGCTGGAWGWGWWSVLPLSRARLPCAALRIVNAAYTIRCVPAPAFLTLPPRPAKPRSFGITHVLDKGMPAVMAEGLLRSVGDVIDIWKFGWGTAYLDPELDLKITLLRRHGVQPCLGGTLLEVAWLQGRAKECVSWAAATGFGMVEISRGVAPMTIEEKADQIGYAAEELIAISEVGSKDPERSVVAGEWREEVVRDLDAGSWKVVAEGRESGTVGLYEPSGAVRVEVAEAIASVDGAERILFEAPKKDQQTWF